MPCLMIQLIINHLNCRSCTYVNISVNTQMMQMLLIVAAPLQQQHQTAPPTTTMANLTKTKLQQSEIPRCLNSWKSRHAFCLQGLRKRTKEKSLPVLLPQPLPQSCHRTCLLLPQPHPQFYHLSRCLTIVAAASSLVCGCCCQMPSLLHSESSRVTLQSPSPTFLCFL